MLFPSDNYQEDVFESFNSPSRYIDSLLNCMTMGQAGVWPQTQ